MPESSLPERNADLLVRCRCDRASVPAGELDKAGRCDRCQPDPGWCVVCCKTFEPDVKKRQFPDGCRAHEHCFLQAPSHAVEHHMVTPEQLAADHV